MIVTWEVEDGYCGGSRPHKTKIDNEELEDCETEEERNQVIDEIIQNDFEQRISWYILGIDKE